MPLAEQRFPELIRRLYEIVRELEHMFSGRPFTPDGHMVGSLAECFAEYYYGLTLYACSHKGHDARGEECDVEIKATQGKTVALRSCPDKLIVLLLLANGSFTEVYNGDGAPVWALVSHKPKASNGQYKVSLASLKRLTQIGSTGNPIKQVRAQPRAPADGPASLHSSGRG